MWSTWNIRKTDSPSTDFSRQPSDNFCARVTLLRREAHSRRASDRSLSIPPASSKAETQLGKLVSQRPRLEPRLSAGSGQDFSRLSSSCHLSELLHVAELHWTMAA